MPTLSARHPKKKKATGEPAEFSCEDLIRLVVSQSTLPTSSGPTGQQSDGNRSEEIIMDVHLDGSHYLLIRLPNESHPHVQLSPREQEIVRMVAKGHPNKIIADVLNISSWTVCTHLRRIFAKLGVSSRAAMVAKMLEESRTWGDRVPGGEKATLVTEAIMSGTSKLPATDAGSNEKGLPGGRAFSRRAS